MSVYQKGVAAITILLLLLTNLLCTGIADEIGEKGEKTLLVEVPITLLLDGGEAPQGGQTETASAAPKGSSRGLIAPAALLVPTLESVPSAIAFGTANAMPARDTTYTAQSVTGNLRISYPALLSLSSLTVSVSLSTFTTGSKQTLQNAQLSLALPSIANSTGLVVLTTSNVNAITLVAGGSSATLLRVLNVSVLALGNSTLTWSPDKATLKVLGGTAAAGNATAILNWTMSAL